MIEKYSANVKYINQFLDLIGNNFNKNYNLCKNQQITCNFQQNPTSRIFSKGGCNNFNFKIQTHESDFS